MRRFSTMVLVTITTLAATATARADALPAKDSTSSFGFNHGLGFSDGTLYLYTGDSIHTVDIANPANPTFTLHMTGIESALGGGARPAEGAIATADNGQALVALGFSGRGALKLDLDAKTMQPVADYDEANLYSAALRADGNAYVQWVADDWSTATRIDHIAPGLAVTTGVADPADLASGGMAFDAAGNLIVGTFDWWNGLAKFYRVAAADLAAFEADATAPTLEFLGQGPANGNGALVVGHDGQIFFNTTTGIGRFDPVAGVVTNLYRDVLDPDLFGYGPNAPLNGLAYDATGQQLIFAEYDSGQDAYFLRFVAVPEPVSLAIMAGGVLLLTTRRRSL